MNRDKRKFAIAIMFFVFTVLSLFGWITRGYASYYLTGIILFTVIGFGFLRSSRY